MAETNGKRRVTLRFDVADYERLHYWAEKSNMSLNELIVLMLEQWIDIQNGSYDLPTLEIQRLNQMNENVTTLSQDIRSFMEVVTNCFNSSVFFNEDLNYLDDIE